MCISNRQRKSNKTKMRFFINTLEGGGAEKVLVDLLRRVGAQYDVEVVAISGGVYASQIPSNVSLRILAGGHSLFSSIKRRILYKMPAGLFVKLFLRQVVDCNVAYLEGFPTHMISRCKEGKRIAFVHCNPSLNEWITDLYKSKEDCFAEYSSLDKVCFVSKGAKEEFERIFGALENASIVHNIIDCKSVLSAANLQPAVELEKNTFNIVAVGRLTAVKGFERLISISAQLEEGRSFTISILGEGAQQQLLEKMIKDNRVHSVRLLGYQNNPYSIVRQADLLICSSYSEGYSTAVTEAAVLGIPVLTTDCAGMDEILGGGKWGVIVKNDTAALCAALRQLLDKPEEYLRLKNKAKERATTLLEQDPLAEYIALFDEVIT